MRDFPDASAAAAAEGDALAWGPATFRTLRPARAGEPAILDCTCAPGFGPPVHALRDAAVALMVTAGEMDVWIDGHLSRLRAGQAASVSAGVSFGFRAMGRAPSRHLHVVAGPGFEAFLRALAGPARPGRRPDFEAAAAHGLEVRGPALGAY